MKTLSLSIILLSLNLASAQTTSNIDSVGCQNDSTLIKLDAFYSAYAKEMANWSPEKKKQFNEHFAYKRGHITIPKEPIKF
jgi:hypothetical protein